MTGSTALQKEREAAHPPSGKDTPECAGVRAIGRREEQVGMTTTALGAGEWEGEREAERQPGAHSSRLHMRGTHRHTPVWAAGKPENTGSCIGPVSRAHLE